MNIKRAKEEIEHTIKAYLAKDASGAYLIPTVRQRPVLLIGPPGIGKTAIMEQISRDCKIALVSYTITHHTRQSAIGLPFIDKKTYGGKSYSVTEYTMSEIIGAVYEKMEATGLSEGILFIDEINCVSETLAPTMLQFLQGKTFGSHQVPKGWVIVAAGNPPEYNKSVREFDIVTLDRVKKIDLEADYGVWKAYGYIQNIHGSIMSYLDIKKENFYKIESTVEGKRIVTARGWEDLSQLIWAYEQLGLEVDEAVVLQYLQHPKIARDFANYLTLYNKYKNDYNVTEILEGRWKANALNKLKAAAFDEKLGVIGLLLSKLNEQFIKTWREDLFINELFEALKELKACMLGPEGDKSAPVQFVTLKIQQVSEALETEGAAGLLDGHQRLSRTRVLDCLEDYRAIASKDTDCVSCFEAIKADFNRRAQEREQKITQAKEVLSHVFDFMIEAFGESQEMVVFITELNTGFYSVKFIGKYGCDQFYKYNKGLLFDEQQKALMDEIASVQSLLNML